MTLSQIRAKVRKHTNTDSTNTGGWTDAEINTLINEAILEIMNVTNSRTASTIDSGSFSTVASSRLYTAPTSSLKIYDAYYDGERIEWIKIEDLPTSGSNQGFWALYGRPTNYYIENAQLGLYPVPNEAKTVKFWYVKRPATLGADADIPELNDLLHPAIEWYCAREIWLDQQKVEQASACGQRYMDKITLYLNGGNEDASRVEFLSENEGV
jgi:hypothetical protein